MSFKSTVKKGFFSGLNPMRWIGYEQLTQNGKVIKSMAKNLGRRPNAANFQPENFDECMQHYGITEADLKKRMRSAFQLALLCFALSIIALIYGVFLFIQHLPLGGFVCVMLTVLLLAYAFREHFNYFQMRQRRLGCSIKEWFVATVKGKTHD